MRNMSAAEAWAFLRAGKRTAKLATTRADGAPHVVPVWFIVVEAAVVFTCAGGSVKGRNLARDPRVAVSVDDEVFPYTFVTVSGSVQVAERPDDLLAWTTRIARRYVGAARAGEYGRRNAQLDDWLVRVGPERILARAEIAL
jgi:PPOX class probable F420-dependent enzyme